MAAKLKVGVVGVGYLGRFHALIYSRMDSVELVGVNDSNPEQASAVAAEAGTGSLSVAELVEQCDAVSIVVPTSLHLEIARPFLEKGVHMLLEKPIEADVAKAEEIVRLASESGTTLQIGHLERYNAGILALAERIENPRFIEAQRMGGFKARATDVDVISDLMIHDIDIILSLVDSPLVSISASGTSVLTDHIDIANARLEFANGAAANRAAANGAAARAASVAAVADLAASWPPRRRFSTASHIARTARAAATGSSAAGSAAGATSAPATAGRTSTPRRCWCRPPTRRRATTRYG